MSGHSKWATIKRQKAVTDQKRGAAYAKLSREIIVASKLGGPDPDANFRLRQAVDRAKQEGMPNDNIHRAIQKGQGGAGEGNVEELTYEGYGPGGIAILVKCTTDNRNRTAGDVRSYFSKFGGNLGETGCVGWMFTERGELYIDKNATLSDDDLMMAALEAGADDIETSDEESVTIICQPNSLEAVRKSLLGLGHKVTRSEVSMVPSTYVDVADKDMAKQLLRLLDALESHDDVQTVYANFDMNPDWLAE